jgi:hypothetical protein
LAIAALVALSVSLLNAAAGAAPPVRNYTLDISPTSVSAGVQTLFTVTVAVTADSTSMGSGQLDFGAFANVSVDCGGTPCSSTTLVTSGGHTWNASVSGSLVQLFASGPGQKMRGGESLSIGVWAKLCTVSTVDVGTATSTVFKASIDLSGSATFTLAGGSHAVTGNASSAIPTQLAITAVADAQDSPLPVHGQPFDVTVESRNSDGDPTPACGNLLVTLGGSPNLGTGTTTGTILDGNTEVTISGVIDTAVENFTLTASAAGLTQGTLFQMIASESVVCTGGSGLSGINNDTGCGGSQGAPQIRGGAPAESTAVCHVTESDPICVELILPAGTGPGPAILALGTCTNYFGVGTCAAGVLIRYLPNLKDADGNDIYTKSFPWTMIVHCDKSGGACPGKGVKSYNVLIDGNDDGVFLTPPACLSANHDIIDPSLTVTLPDGSTKPAEYCTDYVSSHRDNAGDIQLYEHLTSEPDGGGIIK